MLTVTAKEAKNRLGQVFEAAQAAPVEITKNGRSVAFMLSAKQYWAMVGDNLSFDDKFFLVAGVANGEIDLCEAMNRLQVSSRMEFDELSRSFGVGGKDKILTEKNTRRMKFFAGILDAKERQSDVYVFDAIVKDCKVTNEAF